MPFNQLCQRCRKDNLTIWYKPANAFMCPPCSNRFDEEFDAAVTDGRVVKVYSS